MKIIIVGAGPSGLLLGLRLARENIPVTILDLADSLDTRPRATHYSPPANLELEKAGILKDAWEQGFIGGGIAWRKLDLAPIASIQGLPEDKRSPMNGLLCLPLDKLGKLLLKHIERYPSCQILWSHEVIGIEQGEKEATVVAKTPEGEKKYCADYVVGCDGANSKIRRSLFGDWNFPGFTWEEQLVATNVYYDFDKFNIGDGQFIVDPDHWHMVARISKDGMYRVSYGELTGLSHDELIARQPMKYEQMLPGNPKPGDYKLTNCMPYKIHQRCADKFKVGRFMIAADAAHLCNPFGGMGLTGGMVDTGNLADCLIGMEKGLTDDSILERWAEVRKEKWHKVVDPVSSANLRRLCKFDPNTVGQTDAFFVLLERAKDDPSLLNQVVGNIFSLQHDFTADFKKPQIANGV